MHRWCVITRSNMFVWVFSLRVYSMWNVHLTCETHQTVCINTVNTRQPLYSLQIQSAFSTWGVGILGKQSIGVVCWLKRSILVSLLMGNGTIFTSDPWVIPPVSQTHTHTHTHTNLSLSMMSILQSLSKYLCVYISHINTTKQTHAHY